MRRHNKGVCKDANRYQSIFVQHPTLPFFAVPRLPDAISLSCQLFHGFKNPRLFALRASRLYRRPYCEVKKTEGLKAPGYSCSRLSDVFSLITHYSSLIAHRSQLAQRQGRFFLGLGKCNVFLKSDHTDHTTTLARFPWEPLPFVKVPFPRRQGSWCIAGLQFRTGAIPRHTILCSPASSSWRACSGCFPCVCPALPSTGPHPRA